jgi:squalene synthase HpnC
MAVDHYENFPVASVLVPRRLRPAVAAIYWFARTADDLADEGDVPPGERLEHLNQFRDALRRLGTGGDATDPIFARLGEAIRTYGLPLRPFHDLLDAFSQDVVKHRYANFDEVLEYCRRSANPIGTLMLHLVDRASPQNLRWSDAICSGLQLANFWQDIALDWRKGRVYLPQDSLVRFGVTEAQIAAARADPAWQNLLAFEVARARTMLISGAPLARAVGGRFGFELRLVIEGGSRILRRIDRVRGDVFRHRPVLRSADWLVMLWRAVARFPR